MFLQRRFYIVIAVVAIIMAAGVWITPLFILGQCLLVAAVVATALEALTLFAKAGVGAARYCSQRFSLGDDNEVRLRLTNRSPFDLKTEIIDELPAQFQKRDFLLRLRVPRNESVTTTYTLRPTERGDYRFGRVMVFATTPMGLVARRFVCGQPLAVKVYPSFLKLKQYLVAASSNTLTESGSKRVRRAGNNTDFEQIRDYVQGDDYRTINWKATARRTHLMVNVYQDERSQEIYCLIDKGRLMQQSFEGMTLLDYAINASLVLSYVAIRKEDKAGLITFADTFDSFVPASRQSGHMQTMQEALYAQQTVFGETDFSALCAHVNKYVSKRSLMVIYTNFMGVVSLKRQLPFLQQLNRRHRLLVVFFDDMELHDYISTPEENTESVFQHVIAEKFVYEKRLIVNMLRQYGILSLLTTPDQLTVQVINRYLEMKKQGLLT